MAKENIPFDLFRGRNFYEGRMVEVIDIRKCRTGKEYAAVMEKYFDDIFSVTFEDLKSLTAEELNLIPEFWLYDWLHCQWHYCPDGEPEKFIEDIHFRRKEWRMTYDIYDIYGREVHAFIREHEQFTAQEMQEALGITYEEFLAIAYWFITRGCVQFENGTYTKVKEPKR